MVQTVAVGGVLHVPSPRNTVTGREQLRIRQACPAVSCVAPMLLARLCPFTSCSHQMQRRQIIMQLMLHGLYRCLVSKDTTNEKGGTDGRVLWQLLLYYVKTLYPDIADTPGKRLLFKIDGGPGRLDISMLAELRSLGVYLFPGVQKYHPDNTGNRSKLW